MLLNWIRSLFRILEMFSVALLKESNCFNELPLVFLCSHSLKLSCNPKPKVGMLYMKVKCSTIWFTNIYNAKNKVFGFSEKEGSFRIYIYDRGVYFFILFIFDPCKIEIFFFAKPAIKLQSRFRFTVIRNIECCFSEPIDT